MAEPSGDDRLNRARQDDAEDPLTWWNAPGYAEARRRLLDLFELMPALDDEHRRGYWRAVLALSCTRHGAESMTSREQMDLTSNPPDETVEDVERLADAVLPVLRDRVHGRHFRHSLADPGERWASRDRLDDDRVPAIAMTFLSLFDSEPHMWLHRQIGHLNRSGVGGDTFGRMWLTDATSAAWTIVRCFESDMTRWRRY